MQDEEEFLFLSQEAKQYFIEQEIANGECFIEQEIASGVCGKGISWSLKKDGRLIISGKGIMDSMGKIDWEADEEAHEEMCRLYDYMPGVPYTYQEVFVDTAPWRNYRSEIKCVEIAEGITRIGEYAFKNCDNLSSVWLSDTIQTIEYDAFAGCDHLEIDRLPSNLTYLGDDAFLHNGYSACLVSSIPSKLNYIGENAFFASKGNKALKSVTLSKDLTYIGPNAFRGCFNMSLSSKYLPERLSTIGKNAFGGCWNLRQIVFPSGLNSIGDYAFADCHNLTDIEFSDGLECIGEAAFSGCTNIQEIEIPSTVENIKNYAFENCATLKKIVFKGEFPTANCIIYYGTSDCGEGSTAIGQYANYLPFRGVKCVDVYCKAKDQKIWNAITSYSWGAEKMYWHRVY